MILHSGMTFRELADYLFVPIEYVRERHAILIDPPLPRPTPPPKPKRRRIYRTWRPEDLQTVRDMRRDGITVREIAQAFSCSQQAIYGTERHWGKKNAVSN